MLARKVAQRVCHSVWPVMARWMGWKHTFVHLTHQNTAADKKRFILRCLIVITCVFSVCECLCVFVQPSDPLRYALPHILANDLYDHCEREKPLQMCGWIFSGNEFNYDRFVGQLSKTFTLIAPKTMRVG